MKAKDFLSKIEIILINKLKTMNELEILKTPLTKSEQKTIIDKTCQMIMDGEIDAIRAELALKGMEVIIKAIRENNHVKRITRAETDKYGKSFKMFGALIENMSRTSYDYSDCGDDELNNLVAEKAKIEAQIKIREMVIKSGVDINTGQEFFKPKTKTTEYLKITFDEK